MASIGRLMLSRTRSYFRATWGHLKIKSRDLDRGNYQLDLPHFLKIHPYFHEQVLSLYKDTSKCFPDNALPITKPVPADPGQD